MLFNIYLDGGIELSCSPIQGFSTSHRALIVPKSINSVVSKNPEHPQKRNFGTSGATMESLPCTDINTILPVSVTQFFSQLGIDSSSWLIQNARCQLSSPGNAPCVPRYLMFFNLQYLYRYAECWFMFVVSSWVENFVLCQRDRVVNPTNAHGAICGLLGFWMW